MKHVKQPNSTQKQAKKIRKTATKLSNKNATQPQKKTKQKKSEVYANKSVCIKLTVSTKSKAALSAPIPIFLTLYPLVFEQYPRKLWVQQHHYVHI